MKIAYCGNFKHPWCTEVHLARELRGLGHEVREFQEPDKPSIHGRFLRHLEHWCRSYRPDLVMFTRTWGLPPETTQLWRRLEAGGIVTCSYHLDLYLGLKRGERIDNDPFWTTQYVFTPDGDPKSAETFASMGINHHWLSPAVVSDECVPGVWRDEYNYDVVFVGSEGYHAEWPWRGQLLNFLRERYGERFRRFGGDCPEGPTRGKDLNDLYASAKVVVGDSLCLPGHVNYWSDRYFETIGRGGFLVAPWVPGIERFLTPVLDEDDGHFDWYIQPGVNLDHVVEGAGIAVGPPDGYLARLGATIDYWVEHQDRARKIASAGQAHVARYHTYRNRLSQALAIMGFGGVVVDRPGLLIIDDPVGPPVSDDLKRAVWDWHQGLGRREPIEKLELGSGFNPTPGFLHLDINPECNPDIVGAAWPLDLPDCSVGEIRAVDVLEHLSYHNTAEILADWFRVLRPGGKLYVQVPDADLVMRWYVEGERDLLTARLPVNLPVTPLMGVAWRLLGGHMDDVYVKDGDDWRWNAHYALFSAGSLADALVDAGFVDIDIQVNGHPNLLCWASKPA